MRFCIGVCVCVCVCARARARARGEGDGGSGTPEFADITRPGLLTNADRVILVVRFLAPGAEMGAPPAVEPERDALARCGIFTGLFACLYVRHFA